MRLTDDTEKIQLIANDETSTANTRVRATKPDFAALGKKGEINSNIVDLLELAANATSPDATLRDARIVGALFEALQSIRADANAEHYVADFIIDGCKLDTSNWKEIATGSAIRTVYEALKRNWSLSATNDALAFLLSGLLPYNEECMTEVRSVFKQIIDPSQERMTPSGRLAAISNLLRLDSVRVDLANSSTLRSVVAQGLAAKDTEQIYFAVLCLWQMSFNRHVLAELSGPLYIHRTLVRSFLTMFTSLLKKEKIVRASLMTLNNMIDEDWLFEIFLQQKIDSTLTSLSYEKWRDDELTTEVEALLHKFYLKMNQMNNFDRYLKELSNSRFIPGPLHSEKFWLQNVQRFEDNEFEAIKKLYNLLLTCEDTTTLSLAVFDLGEFARLYPTGKQITAHLGAKEKIMDLMNHSNKEVAREALLSTQKMMLDSWKVLNTSAS